VSRDREWMQLVLKDRSEEFGVAVANVSDPHSFNPDTDPYPTKISIQIRILDPDPGSRIQTLSNFF
jgi:hypothetical protein